MAYSLLLLVSTIFVCERRARGDLRNSQFGLKAAFAATCACAIVAMMWTNDFVIWNYGEPMHELVILHGCGLADFGWYVIAPMLFGITCMVFTVGWIIFWIAAQIIRRFSRRIATIKLGP